jgi:hypothetical protein
MLSNLQTRIKLLFKLPIAVSIVRVLGKLGIQNSTLRRIDFLSAPDASRPTKATEILFHWMDQIGANPSDALKKAAGGTVLEIGCGRYAGFAPIATLCNASRYIGIDPGLDPAVLKHRKVATGYFLPGLEKSSLYLQKHWTGLTQIPSPDTKLLNQLYQICDFRRAGIVEAMSTDEQVDLCLSISCLEHIQGFDEAAKTMAALSKPDTLHIHIVYFSNHLSKDKPFQGLYDKPFPEFAKAHSNLINGLRVTDLEQLFENAGLSLQMIPLDIRPDALPDSMDPYWTDKYNLNALSTRVAMFTTLPVKQSPAAR